MYDEKMEINKTRKEYSTRRVTGQGFPLPLGATVMGNGTNFSIFSKNASQIILELYENYYDDIPAEKFFLSEENNKTGDIWHIFLEGIGYGHFYGYRAAGVYNPLTGDRFNEKKMLTDPYSKAISGAYNWDEEYAYGYDRNSPQKDLTMSRIDSGKSPSKSIVIDDSRYDWENDKPLRIPMKDTVIYEMHVRLFTESDSSEVSSKGCFSGILEKMDHLKELGITSVELMPIFEFNPNSNIHTNPITGERLKNIWGYDPLAFFAVEGSYTCGLGIGEQTVNFKNFVKEMHRNGFEIILDVVFNHTGEGGNDGPTLSFRGLDNKIYYILTPHNKRFYENYSGCGNTLNCNTSVVKMMIIDCLRYWVTEMHVDGFRFDLAAILGRAPDGRWIGDLSLLKDISDDPVLSGTKLIAEGWDAAGGYFLGAFPEGWAEWNGQFRDVARRFVRGDEGLISQLATRISGSSDLYDKPGKKPFNSINFITAHDGFTLWDLVSYNEKHNFLNGENNMDGTNDNFSFNHGVEGETTLDEIISVRKKQIKNFFNILFISQGTPMILMGDEFCRTQFGNNNAYCHDSSLTWVDWSLKEKNKDIFDYLKKLIDFRKNHKCLRREHFFTGKKISHGVRDITWHGTKLKQPDWSFNSHSIAFVISGDDLDFYGEPDNDIYVAFNSYTQPLDFEIPIVHEKMWFRVADTGLESPDDFIRDENLLTPYPQSHYRLKERSSAIFISRKVDKYGI